jgi:hypothetical protein
MAYFSNGTEGMVFDSQCAKCKYGEKPCPIAFIQMEYNYDQIKSKNKGDDTAFKIMNELVKPDGTCTMYEFAKQDFAIDPNQTKLEL